MTVIAARVNHPVPFAADRGRRIPLRSEAFGVTVMSREPVAGAAFPRSGRHRDVGRPATVRRRPGFRIAAARVDVSAS